LRTTESKDLRLPLPLPLHVSAVILSAAKNPEELNQPQPLGSFTHALSGPLPLMLPVLLPPLGHKPTSADKA
jgi:hypothetical protein